MSRWIGPLRRWLLASSFPWWASLALAALAVWPASHLRLEQSIEAFYPPHSQSLADYRHSKAWFGGDEFVIVAFQRPGLFGTDGLLQPDAREEVSRFAKQLSQVPGVDPQGTRHLAEALAFDRFSFLLGGKDRLLQLAEGWLVGSDRETTAIVLRLLPDVPGNAPRAATIRQIREVAAAFPRPTFVVGEPVQIHDTFRYIEEDGAILGWASLSLLALVIGGIFRQWRWVLLPVVVVEVTVVWTKGLLALSGLQLSMVGSMLNSLLMVIGTATVIHVMVRYREHLESGDARAAVAATWSDLAGPIFWTTVTTAAGFAAQCTSHAAPVKSFGLMMMVGTLLIMIACATLLPTALRWCGGPLSVIQPHWETGLERALGWLYSVVQHRPRWVAAFAVGVVVWASLGMLRLRVETDFSRNFRAGTPIVQALELVETRLGGAGVWEVHFRAPSRLDQEYLDRVDRLADNLRRLSEQPGSGLTKVVAYTDGLALTPPLPLTMRRTLLGQFQPEWEGSFYRSTVAVPGEPESGDHPSGRMRIMLRARERQTAADKVALIGAVEQLARAEFPDARVAGIFVLFTGLIQSVLGDQWFSFLYGAVAILGLMTIAFRSWRWGLMSLVPNIVPIGMVLGTIGWWGVPMNLGTAMISSVSLGLTVDSSIHYFAGYLRAVQQGCDPLVAHRRTTLGVGAALVYTNLALVIGFLVLTLSHFLPLVDFGILVGVAMFGGLLGNLVFLPWLMRSFPDRPGQASRTGSGAQ